jgi:hypothetical protein
MFQRKTKSYVEILKLKIKLIININFTKKNKRNIASLYNYN